MFKLSEIPIYPYYHVPKCPFCGSSMTGRFIKQHNTTDTEWAINEALRNGELVKAVPEITDNNVFCLDCGEVYKDDVKHMILTKKQLNEEKEKRNTVAILTDRYEKMKEEEARKNKPFGFIRKYIGKL